MQQVQKCFKQFVWDLRKRRKNKQTNTILCHIVTQASSSHFKSYKPIYCITVNRHKNVPACIFLPALSTSHTRLLSDTTGRKQVVCLTLIGNDIFIQNNGNHKTVGTKKTLYKGTSFKVTINVWTAVMCSF